MLNYKARKEGNTMLVGEHPWACPHACLPPPPRLSPLQVVPQLAYLRAVQAIVDLPLRVSPGGCTPPPRCLLGTPRGPSPKDPPALPSAFPLRPLCPAQPRFPALCPAPCPVLFALPHALPCARAPLLLPRGPTLDPLPHPGSNARPPPAPPPPESRGAGPAQRRLAARPRGRGGGAAAQRGVLPACHGGAAPAHRQGR